VYQIFWPDKNLAPFIECYWILRAELQDGMELGESIFVDGNSDLIFNFGSPYRRVMLGKGNPEKLISFSNLDATRLSAVQIVQSGNIHLLGIRFKAGGLAAFQSIPAHDLTDQVFEVTSIFGAAIKDLEGQLFDARHKPHHQVHLLDQFWLKRLIFQQPLELSYQVTRYIAAYAGQLGIDQLSEQFGYSPRHLGRLYQHYVGVPLKFQTRIARFRQALEMLLKDTTTNLSQIASTCGYYDQAHLNKEFIRFAGQSPNHYRVALLLKSNAAIPPNLVRFLQDE